MFTETSCPIFDELVLLKDDPEAFEARRNQLLEESFAQMPADAAVRCRQQQWNIESQLAKYKDPMARHNRMVELFWAGFAKFNDALNSKLPPQPPTDQPKATVTHIGARK